ncbi:hypothetical protein QQS21_006013 [Conoideocrella luteorostrata]|uniref:Uncharacterized protein n=1 Tax=Conoideocrella luteorostrata TaxID=1105319 RepID=A0AAJ0FYM4_9HYPO|nr:hypothetical protein QQS21_006013 [Conoideocrella luteorostrata]
MSTVSDMADVTIVVDRISVEVEAPNGDYNGNISYNEDGYNLTDNPYALPEKFMDEVVCSELFVEFLKTTSTGQPVEEKKNASNHVVFKLIFKSPRDGFLGLRLEMAVDYKYKSKCETIAGRSIKFKSGYLCAKPSATGRTSTKSALTCKLDIAPNWSVGAIIRTLLHYQMSSFDFVNVQDKYFGCRDFTSQAIMVMISHGFIISDQISLLCGPSLPVGSIYDALGLRITYHGVVHVCPIDKGRFISYQRQDWAGLPYEGSYRANQLAELIYGRRR